MVNVELIRANFACLEFQGLPVPESYIRRHVVWGCGGPDVISKLPWTTFVFEGVALEKFRSAAKAERENAPALVLLARDPERKDLWEGEKGKHMYECDTIQLLHIMLDGGSKSLDSYLYMSFDKDGVKKAFPELAGHDLRGIVALGIGAGRCLKEYDERCFMHAPRYCR